MSKMHQEVIKGKGQDILERRRREVQEVSHHWALNLCSRRD
jgi:hypothetical protein